MNVKDVLKYGHRSLTSALNDFPVSAVETPGACGVWSVKNIVEHLASYEWVLVDVFNSLLGVGSTPYLDRFVQEHLTFNDSEVDRRQGQSFDQSVAEYQEAHDKVMALAGQIPPPTYRQLNVLPWYGTAYDLEDFIVYTFYGHKREHMAQIAAFRDIVLRQDGA
ncbi:MAG: hypothetical protein DCC55_34415 [Chloroflexi bacterium]|nr:MAG: hypothetical protein DCC55_34415 [Chloroflexota bacterium]